MIGTAKNERNLFSEVEGLSTTIATTTTTNKEVEEEAKGIIIVGKDMSKDPLAMSKVVEAEVTTSLEVTPMRITEAAADTIEEGMI
mmetsp:Transcript_33606/g.46540  ORF Transcript_33606/g.46540 Transcript_33606/m.46540 type:complete len:86 (-) Transcript_33606:598-855(-)